MQTSVSKGERESNKKEYTNIMQCIMEKDIKANFATWWKKNRKIVAN